MGVRLQAATRLLGPCPLVLEGACPEDTCSRPRAELGFAAGTAHRNRVLLNYF